MSVINELYPCIQGEGLHTGVPSILIRTTGCRLRCQFANSFCDTWFSSWKPEKGKFDIDDVRMLIDMNPQINHLILSGGGPTLHPTLLNDIVNLAVEYSYMLTLETEGSEYARTDSRINMLSLSPKLKSTTPKLGTPLPFHTDKIVTQQQIDQHEKWRTNYESMNSWIGNSHNVQVKFVISSEEDIDEALWIVNEKLRGISLTAVMFMPCGENEDQLNERRVWLTGRCIELGIRYTDRLHVVIFGDKRGV